MFFFWPAGVRIQPVEFTLTSNQVQYVITQLGANSMLIAHHPTDLMH